MIPHNEDPDVKAMRLQQQRRVGLLWLASAIAILIVMTVKRGHPKNWRMGETWVTRWGGDWEAMQREIAYEKLQRKTYEEMLERQNKLLETANLEEIVGETVSLDTDQGVCTGDECAAEVAEEPQ